jgi:hypothetical protein
MDSTARELATGFLILLGILAALGVIGGGRTLLQDDLKDVPVRPARAIAPTSATSEPDSRAGRQRRVRESAATRSYNDSVSGRQMCACREAGWNRRSATGGERRDDRAHRQGETNSDCTTHVKAPTPASKPPYKSTRTCTHHLPGDEGGESGSCATTSSR